MEFIETPTPNSKQIEHNKIDQVIELNMVVNLNELNETEVQKIQCKICQGVLRYPAIQCGDCKGVACSICVEQQLNRELTCPFKEECGNFEHFPYYNDGGLDILMEKLKIRCKFYSEKLKENEQNMQVQDKKQYCDKILEYKDLEKHFQECKDILEGNNYQQKNSNLQDSQVLQNSNQNSNSIEQQQSDIKQQCQNKQFISEQNNQYVKLQFFEQNENNQNQEQQQQGNIDIQYMMQYIKDIRYEVDQQRKQFEQQNQVLQNQIEELQYQNSRNIQYFTQLISQEMRENMKILEKQLQQNSNQNSQNNIISQRISQPKSFLSSKSHFLSTSNKFSQDNTDNSQSRLNSNLLMQDDQYSNKFGSSLQTNINLIQVDSSGSNNLNNNCNKQQQEGDLAYIQKIDEINEIQEYSFNNNSKSDSDQQQLSQQDIQDKVVLIQEKLVNLKDKFQDLQQDTLQQARKTCLQKQQWKNWEDFKENCQNFGGKDGNNKYHDKIGIGQKCYSCYESLKQYQKAKKVVAVKMVKLKQEKDRLNKQLLIMQKSKSMDESFIANNNLQLLQQQFSQRSSQQNQSLSSSVVSGNNNNSIRNKSRNKSRNKNNNSNSNGNSIKIQRKHTTSVQAHILKF